MKTPENHIQKFSGNPFFCFNTVFLAAAFAGLIFVRFDNTERENIKLLFLFFALLFIMLYFFLGSQMSYFIIDRDRLIIKNHYLFWLKAVFLINDIISARVVEPQYNTSRTLSFTTKYGEKWRYSGASLRLKDWKNLKEAMYLSGVDITL